MAKRLTESERKRLLKQYRANEERNAHKQNAINLIKRFGTTKKKAEATKRSNKPYNAVQQMWFYKQGHSPYFKKLIPK